MPKKIKYDVLAIKKANNNNLPDAVFFKILADKITYKNLGWRINLKGISKTRQNIIKQLKYNGYFVYTFIGDQQVQIVM